ncbi:MAG: cohesin domain-containing protein [Patescibacteria group bacterium]
MSHFVHRLTTFPLLFLFFWVVVLCTQSQARAQSVEPASLLFVPETISTGVGQQFTTQVWIDTAGASVGGVGAKINFNATSLSVEKIETLPVFPDYPATTFDNETGSINISGIVRSKDELYTGKGQFATITWKTKGAGDSSIAFNYVPNSTNDSNIAVLYGNGDILQKTNSVVIQVAAAPASSRVTDSTAESTAEPAVTSEAMNSSDKTPEFSKTDQAPSPIVILIGVATLFSLGFQAYLYFKMKRIEKYKEAIPHIHTPS